VFFKHQKQYKMADILHPFKAKTIQAPLHEEDKAVQQGHRFATLLSHHFV
jgi:hypothetical protein